MADCASCTGKPCGNGSHAGAPEDCPALTYSPEYMLSLYSESEREIARQSARTEAEGYCRDTRIEEIMDFAHKMGYKHLGLAFCRGLSSEGSIVETVLRANGFTVDSVCCKTCSVPKTAVGLTREEFVRKDAEAEYLCNPIGQAKILDDAGCEFAILLGLCVGHDTLFIKHIQAPCTVFAVKDRAMGNNPLAAIYTANNYSKRIYRYIETKYGKKGNE